MERETLYSSKERLCMLWGNPVIFTDCGENPMITVGFPASACPLLPPRFSDLLPPLKNNPYGRPVIIF
jgi:hypothetical protein